MISFRDWSPSPSYLTYQKLNTSHNMSNFSCYNQNSAVVVTTMIGFFHSNTQFLPPQHCREGCPGKYKTCFLVTDNQQISIIFTHVYINFVNLGTDKIKRPDAQDRPNMGKVRPVQAPIHWLLHRIPYPNPSLLCYFSFKPPPKRVSSHPCLPSLWPVPFILPCRLTGMQLLQTRSLSMENVFSLS